MFGNKRPAAECGGSSSTSATGTAVAGQRQNLPPFCFECVDIKIANTNNANQTPATTVAQFYLIACGRILCARCAAKEGLNATTIQCKAHGRRPERYMAIVEQLMPAHLRNMFLLDHRESCLELSKRWRFVGRMNRQLCNGHERVVRPRRALLDTEIAKTVNERDAVQQSRVARCAELKKLHSEADMADAKILEYMRRYAMQKQQQQQQQQQRGAYGTLCLSSGHRQQQQQQHNLHQHQQRQPQKRAHEPTQQTFIRHRSSNAFAAQPSTSAAGRNQPTHWHQSITATYKTPTAVQPQPVHCSRPAGNPISVDSGVDNSISEIQHVDCRQSHHSRQQPYQQQQLPLRRTQIYQSNVNTSTPTQASDREPKTPLAGAAASMGYSKFCANLFATNRSTHASTVSSSGGGQPLKSILKNGSASRQSVQSSNSSAGYFVQVRPNDVRHERQRDTPHPRIGAQKYA